MEDVLATGKGDDLIQLGLPLPQIRELGLREQCNVRVWKRLAETLQSGRAHHGVAEPIHSSHQEALRM